MLTRKLAVFCLLFFCLACSNASSNPTGETSPPGGKLYLRTMWWAMNNTMEIKWIYLGDDGSIVMHPKHGANPVKLAEEKKDNRYTGTYKVSGDNMTITWKDGATETWYVQKKGGVFTALNKAPATVAQPLPANFRFTQTYPAHAFLENEDAMHRIEFRSDGSFQFNKYPLSESTVADKTTGTYSVSKNTITLSFPGGKTAVASIGFVPNTKSLVINTEYQDL